MLPRQRVETTLRHEEPDLVPWGEHSIDYNIYEMTLGRQSWVHSKIRETRGYWDGRRDEIVASYKRDIPELVRALGMDIVTVGTNPPAGYHPQPLEQVDEVTYRDGHGNVFRVSSATEQLMPYKVQTEGYVPPTAGELQERIDRLEAEPPTKPGDSCWEVMRHVVSEMKGTHWINVCTGGLGFPVIGPTDEIGYLNLALLEPEVLSKWTELQAKQQMAHLPWYAEEGVDSVMPCADLGSSTGLLGRPSLLREIVQPWWEEHNRRAHDLGLVVVKHCCGNIWEALPMICDAGFDGYEGIQASGTMDMRVLKERYGGRLTLWGGVWNEHLILGTPEDIDADARYAISHGAPGGGFIYGATHSLAMGTKHANLQAMKAARERYGAYPIGVPDLVV